MMDPHITTSQLASFLYQLMRDEVPVGTVEKLVQESETCGEPSPHALSNDLLGQYAEDLAKRLTANLVKTVISDLVADLQDSNQQLRILRDKSEREIAELNRTLATEREALVAWLVMRIKQQQQALTNAFVEMSAETKRFIEIEIGFLERYKTMVLNGSHRPNPALLGTYG